MSATRRETLQRAALGSAGLTALALLRPALASAQEAEDLRDFLEPAIELEQASVLAYAATLEAQGLDAELRGTLERLRDQEQAHANALRSALDSLGFDPPEPPEQPGESEHLEGIAGAMKPDEYLEVIAGVEQDLVDLYVESAPELESVDLARTAAEIVGSHAQHLFVLRAALGDDAAEALAAVNGG